VRKFILLASAAAMAAAMPALAKDHGRGGRGGGSDWSEHRGGDRGDMRAERRRGGEERGRSERRWHGDDDNDDDRGRRWRSRGDDDDDNRRWSSRGDDDRRWRGRDRDDDDDRRRMFSQRGLQERWRDRAQRRSERRAQAIGQRIDRGDRYAAVPDAWRYRFRDDADAYYRYGDDNVVYRIDRRSNSIASMIPLLASGLAVGDALPLGFDTYNLPLAYRDNYVDGTDALYRYDEGAIYQVDPQSRMIEGIVALLGGDPLSVGAPLPTGYDAYNLPLAYRDDYVDDADSLYRYSNGSIFEIDPQTMLVRALVEMIA
jgi:hypothetical protein